MSFLNRKQEFHHPLFLIYLFYHETNSVRMVFKSLNDFIECNGRKYLNMDESVFIAKTMKDFKQWGN